MINTTAAIVYLALWVFAIILISRSVETPRSDVPVKVVKVTSVSP